jgi:hypothetical protein
MRPFSIIARKEVMPMTRKHLSQNRLGTHQVCAMDASSQRWIDVLKITRKLTTLLTTLAMATLLGVFASLKAQTSEAR